jgi:polygalacturonase
MKKPLLFLLAAATLLPATAKKNSGPWAEADKIVKNIRTVSFPKREYNIKDFGALAATPERPISLAHEAINLAITTCSQAGGGTVVIPDSTYITGPITLKSNVNLHLSDGAVLKFSTDPDLYYPAVLTRWEGIDCYNAHPLIYAYGESNIAITGKGTLDAQGANENWWSMCGAAKYGWQEGMVAQKNGARARLLEWGESGTPVFRRVFTAQDGMRPQFVNIYRCNTVLIEDVELLNSPFWVLHPLFTEDLTVRGVKVYNRGPNGDGCDPESCKNVLIEGCTFDTGDDCIAIKSGRNLDGRKWNTPSENIVVRNCKMVNGHGGVVVGSEISGGYRNLYVENCQMDSPELERVVRIKTSSCRGGVIENIFVRNVTVGQCKEAVLRINLDYEAKEVCQRGNNPTVRNVQLENVTCQKSRYGVLLIGLDDVCNIYDVQVRNCDFNGVTGDKKTGDLNSYTGRFRNVTYDQMKINGSEVAAPADRL